VRAARHPAPPPPPHRPHDRDLWLRRHGYVARRYGRRQIEGRPDAVVADLEDAFAQAVTLGYAAAA
jgi:hypothetical protein